MRNALRTGFLVGVGLFMIGFWSLLVGTGQIPELQTAPYEIGYHLTAELLTALALLTAGVGSHLDRDWGRKLVPVALGMLGYTVINSAGYYAQMGEWSIVTMFSLLTVGTAILVWNHLNSTPESTE